MNRRLFAMALAAKGLASGRMDHKSTPARVRELEQRVRKLETAYLGLLKEGA